ncbi:MAG: Trk system potassium transporter TrkA [Lachnospiraceae bacterium]|nr:Trk system potassium transporter TrkA [Lachnospiraceae bacterium]
MFSKKDDKSGLRIIIVGCGKVGNTITEQLCKEGHDVTIIDKDASAVQAISNLYDIMGVVGNGASYSVQDDAGIHNTDLLIAVTESDELNLLCCTIAKQVSGCATIARVRTPDYSKEVNYLREKLGLAMIINPEMEAAKEAARILYMPNALEVNAFAHGQAEMIKFKIPEGNMLVGKTLFNMARTAGHDFLICAIERDKEVFIPSGDFQLEAGDIVSFVAPRAEGRRFFKEIGIPSNQVKNCMIIGGGKAAYYLAARLIRAGIDVKIIESDKARCEELSIMLPKAIIIHGDGTDADLLKEEGLESVEAFVPLTGIDEENIMLTLHARKVSKAKVITKINRINFTDAVSSLDLGSVIYPRFITTEAIIAYVRARKASIGSNVETLYHMFDSKVEAIEFRVKSESEVTNIPLKDLPLHKELLISFINRNGKIIIPGGLDCIMPGDTVMIVTTHSGFKDIRDILRTKRH